MIVESSAIGRIVIPEGVPPGFALFYTTSDFPGRLNGDASTAIRGVVRDRFGIKASLTTCTQVHGTTVTRAPLSGSTSPWSECDSCDALWTSERATALGIKVADCLPVTMLDPIHSVIANIHSGWRGAASRITSCTLDTIESETAFSPADSFVFLGPSIRACCFEVGEEVVEAFSKSYGDVARFTDRTRRKPHVDLPALTAELLADRGFRPERIVDSGLCTRCDGSLFHSYRRDGGVGGGGRNLAVVAQ
jgi:YfiH family protein